MDEKPKQMSVRQRRKMTTAQFWEEAAQQGVRLDLAPWEQTLCCYVICGMPSWQALQRVVDEYEVPSMFVGLPEAVSAVRVLAEQMLNRPNWREFCSWAAERSQELYALNLHEYDWRFKDSEIELRFLIDVAKQRIAKTQKLSSDVMYAIINATKELNAMYKYNGPGFDSTKAKLVIFADDDELED